MSAIGRRTTRRTLLATVGLASLGLAALRAQPAASGTLPRLTVSENHRYLVTDDGRPFFWLGDTAWELFHRLTREEAGARRPETVEVALGHRAIEGRGDQADVLPALRRLFRRHAAIERHACQAQLIEECA